MIIIKRIAPDAVSFARLGQKAKARSS